MSDARALPCESCGARPTELPGDFDLAVHDCDEDTWLFLRFTIPREALVGQVRRAIDESSDPAQALARVRDVLDVATFLDARRTGVPFEVEP